MADEVDLTADIESGDLDAGITAAAPAPAGTVPAHGADAVLANAAPAKVAGEPSSLRDQLSAAFKDENGAPTDQQAAASVGEQARGPDGKFVTQPEAAPATDTQAQPAAVQVPQGFDAAQFAALPAEMQQQVARTMAAVEEQATRYSGYEQLEQVIGNRRQAWAVQGMSEAQAVNQLLALSDFAGQSPTDFVRWFTAQHGIDLAALAEDGGDEEFYDPAVLELRQQVEHLTGQLTSITQGQQSAQHNSLVELTAKFGTETGTDGQPLRPHFNELGAGIIPYISQVKAENPNGSATDILAQAYERACWGTPAIREKLLAHREAERLAELRVTAERAKTAGSSVTGDAPSAGSERPKDIGSGTVRDTLRAAIAQHTV